MEQMYPILDYLYQTNDTLDYLLIKKLDYISL